MSISTVVFRFLDTPYFSTNELSTISERTKLESNNFSILHINIRSIRKNFDAFESFLSSSACRFKALRITETWCDKSSCKSSLFNIPNYKSVQQYRSIKKKVVDVVYSYTISKILCCVRISIRIIIKKSKYFIDYSQASRWRGKSRCYFFYEAFPAGIYLFKVNNRNTRTRCQICSKLTIKTTKRR